MFINGSALRPERKWNIDGILRLRASSLAREFSTVFPQEHFPFSASSLLTQHKMFPQEHFPSPRYSPYRKIDRVFLQEHSCECEPPASDPNDRVPQPYPTLSPRQSAECHLSFECGLPICSLVTLMKSVPAGTLITDSRQCQYGLFVPEGTRCHALTAGGPSPESQVFLQEHSYVNARDVL